MTNKLVGFLLLGAIILGSTSCVTQVDRRVFIFSDRLKLNETEVEYAFKKERSPIGFETNVIATNCLEYLLEVVRSEIKDTTYNLLLQEEYLSCEALDLIKGKVGSKEKPSINYGNEIAAKLDLSSFPSSLNRRARKGNLTLLNLGSNELTIEQSFVSLDTDEWTFTIELAASTDLNNDNIDDLIIWVYDKAKFGSYSTYTTLVVPIYNDNQKLLATPYNKWR